MKKVTDEHIHDNKVLPELVVENIEKSHSMTAMVKLFADFGTYDNNDIFRYISDNEILPCI